VTEVVRRRNEEAEDREKCEAPDRKTKKQPPLVPEQLFTCENAYLSDLCLPPAARWELRLRLWLEDGKASLCPGSH